MINPDTNYEDLKKISLTFQKTSNIFTNTYKIATNNVGLSNNLIKLLEYSDILANLTEKIIDTSDLINTNFANNPELLGSWFVKVF
ncbi:hypothetical protein [Ligilactobacillus hayakitensis]|uniref:hypothetical protein n=1 Tax=Ligilactobacillus hayakitensis TaxID=396716 RepID=UPI000468A8C2|nr:hypothetical protein [Ligilactobacillus hayakitensis]